MKKYIFIALTFIVAGLIFLTTTTNRNPLHIYLLPENFVGEVEVTFDQANDPPLPKERNSYIYAIPISGKLKTSSTMQSGPVEVYYVDDQGHRKKASHEEFHGVFTKDGGEDNPSVATLFIGTKEQYDNHVRQQ